MRLKDIAVGTADQFKFDPRVIQIDPGYNIRVFYSTTDEADAELKASSAENGIQVPLTVRLKNDVVYVVAGHRRLAAIKELISEGHEFVSVPCISEVKGATEADRTLHLLTSNQGKPLTALEKAEVFKRLINNHGWAEDAVAKKAGITTKQVQNLLTLAGASDEVKELVSTNVVAPTVAIRVIKSYGDEAGAILTEAKAVAVAAGKTKVTAATTRAVTAPAPVVASNPGLSMLGLPVAPSAPPLAATPRAPRIINTPAKFEELLYTLREVLTLDDIAVIHQVVRDALGLKEAA